MGSKLYSMAKTADHLNLHVICIQEFIHKNDGQKLIELYNGNKYEIYWAGNDQKRRNGVAILVGKNDNLKLEPPDIKTERIIALHATIESFPIRIISAYAPTNVNDDSEKE